MNEPPRRDPRPVTKNPTPTDWGRVAAWYDQLVGETGSEYQRDRSCCRAWMRLLDYRCARRPGSRPQRVLDVACGQGVLCRILHKEDVTVTGVDASKELVKLARERSDPAIPFFVGDARELGKISGLTRAAGGFHAAACVLAIQNIHPLEPIFSGVANVLVPGGRFVIAMMHPCFRGPKATSWGWDEAKKVQYRRTDRYLISRKEPIVTHPGSDPGKYTWTFHEPLEAYVRAAAKAGLLIDALEEWPSHKVSDSGPRAGAENVARQEIPMFLAMRAVKAGQPPLPS